MPSKQTIVKSLFWKFLERSGTQGTQFIVSIILARLLAPEDFGLVALVLIFITIANVFVDSGLNTALIQKKDADDLDFSTVFWTSLGLAGLIYVVLFLSVPIIAAFYEKPELISIFRVLSLTLFLGVFQAIQNTYVSRKMLFKKLFYRSIGSMVPAGILGIVLAFCNFGIWAIVFQQLCHATLSIIIMWFTVPWRPKCEFSFTRFKKLFSFGWKLLLSSLIDTCYIKIRGLLIGKMFSPTDLAFYDRGDHFPYLIVRNINTSIQAVLMPSLSSVQNDKETFKRMTQRAIKTSSFLIIPMMVGLATSAEQLVLILLGEKWLPCVPFIQIYSMIYALYPIHTSNLSAINSLGRSDIFLKLEIIKKTFGLTFLVGSLIVFRSPLGIALGTACNSLLSAFLNASPNKKLLNYGYFEQIRDILPSVLLSLCMGGVVFAISLLNLSFYIMFVLQMAAGFLFYVGVAKLFHFECLEYLIQTLKGIKHGK